MGQLPQPASFDQTGIHFEAQFQLIEFFLHLSAFEQCPIFLKRVRPAQAKSETAIALSENHVYESLWPILQPVSQ
ncbi:hypothetical protein A2G06_10160 [Geobacter anodireducens]|nr:hypothetical protein A2G06_10160 [Geobacter anodireducens]